jgi:multicomponent Na+:H+ antiporter subunit E
MHRLLSLALWAFVVWVLLTWTRTTEQLAWGAVAAVAVAIALAPLGPVTAPWRLADPRRLALLGRLLVESLGRVVVANVSLARRVWSPARPLRSGMLIVPTEMRTTGGIAAVGMITSVIVDQQLVDLDPAHRLLQYHAVWITTEDPAEARERINGPVERLLRPLEGDR